MICNYPKGHYPLTQNCCPYPFSGVGVFQENNVIYFIFKNLIILANYPYNSLFKYCLVVSKNSAYHRCWERLKAGGDGWMVSPTRWTGV